MKAHLLCLGYLIFITFVLVAVLHIASGCVSKGAVQIDVQPGGTLNYKPQEVRDLLIEGGLTNEHGADIDATFKPTVGL